MSNLNGFVLNSTQVVLELVKGKFKIVVMHNIDEYGMSIVVYENYQEYINDDFKTLSEAVDWVNGVISGDIDYEWIQSSI